MLTLFRLFALALVGWCLGIMVFSTIMQFGPMAGIATALIPVLVLRINHEVQRAVYAAENKRFIDDANAMLDKLDAIDGSHTPDELARRRTAKQSGSANLEA